LSADENPAIAGFFYGANMVIGASVLHETALFLKHCAIGTILLLTM
jgi:hypothetical protein